MSLPGYLIWNGSPELFNIGDLVIRWYGLFFAIGFLIGQQIIYYIFRKENKPEKDVDALTIYMVVATIIGARLGHVLFYEPDVFFANPMEILKVWQGGLASHGAAIAILIALWIYSRKKKAGQSYFQVLDRIVIIAALASAFIRFGNFFNSEIIGKPTDKPWGIVFVNPLATAITNEEIDTEKIVDRVSCNKNNNVSDAEGNRKHLAINVFFKTNTAEEKVTAYINNDVKDLLNQFTDFFDQKDTTALNYEIIKQQNGSLEARINTLGISRHPAQLYEAVSFLLIFILLFGIWIRYKQNLPPGRNLGIFLVICFGLRFIYEFLKEDQVQFENSLPLNMGQILSIPLCLAGVWILILSFKKKEF